MLQLLFTLAARRLLLPVGPLPHVPWSREAMLPCTTGHLPLSLVDHVQFIRINSSLAKGPTLGRSLNSGMYAGQDYFMQIDSHTKFAPGWDVRLVRQYRWARTCCSAEMAV